ncbi:MAG: glycosyltransferase [Candidatus Odinarchaeota archaeon]
MILIHIIIYTHCTHENKRFNLPIGGISSAILELLPNYERYNGLKITLISKYSEYKPISNNLKIYNLSKFVPSKINTFYFFLKSFFKIIKINKKHQITAINIHSFYFDSIIPLLLHLFFKIPLLMKPPSDFDTQQREIFLSKSFSFFKKLGYYGWMKIFRKFIAKRKKIYFQAINDKIYKDLIRLKIRKKNIIKLPNGISIKTYGKIRKYNKKETHFGYVGRLIRTKNLVFLLNSFKKYLSIYKDDKLYIFGKGPEDINISKFIIDNNLTKNIILMGFEQKKEKIYSKINVLIHPTFGEGCPNTILESILSNTFVIASNVSGIREIIEHKKSGLLFNPFKEDDLLKQLYFLKGNKESVIAMSNYAKKIIEKKYDVNIISNQIIQFLKKQYVVKSPRKHLKISVITPAFPYPERGILPGLESFVESFALPLCKLGHKVQIVTTYWNGGNRYGNYDNISILRIYDSKALFGKIGSIFYLNHIIFGLNLLRKKNFNFYRDSDAIILSSAIGFTRFLKLKKLPIISTFLHYDKFLSHIDHLTLPFYHRLEKKQFNHHKRIITISDSSKSDIIKHYGVKEEHIKVYPIGINRNRFNPSKFSKKIREKYGDKILLFVGPMIYRKRIPILLIAMQRVIKVFPDVKLILLGDGPSLEKYIKFGKKLKIDNNLVWRGFFDKPEIYYGTADIFVFPSELEGFGQVIVEAMACGIPVICADKPPMSEIINGGGVTFKLNDSKDLAEKIIDLLKNKEKLEILKENSLKVVEKYEDLTIAKNYVKFIKRVRRTR